MKIKLVGDGELKESVTCYLQKDVVYEAKEYDHSVDLLIVTVDEDDPIIVNYKNPEMCGHLCDCEGNLRWEVVDAS